MIICQAYKYRLETNHIIEQKLIQFSGCCRFVWNKSLYLIKKRLEFHTPILWYNDLAGLLKLWKQSEEFSFLKKVHSQILQQTLKNLDRAINDAFDKSQPNKKFPVFKKKHESNSFRYPQGFKVDNNKVYLPKIGWVKFKKSREILGIIKNITIKKEGKYWYVVFVTKKEKYIIKRNNDPIGIDVGVNKIVTLSNGCYFTPLDFTKLDKKLKKEQRKLSRKQHPKKQYDKTKISKNYLKQSQKVNKIHTKINNMRYDYLHKLSTAITKNHGIVVIEDLKIKEMTKSAKGTIVNPGKNVKIKSQLNKSVLYQGWGIFTKMIKYKLEYSGGKLIKVKPYNTSLTCPKCNTISKNNRKNQNDFACVACNYNNNADLIGAINILSKAGYMVTNLPQDMREVKPVEYTKYMMKQEPELYSISKYSA